jgi:hypothetical protein
MSELEKIASIISWIQNISRYDATFGDVAYEFGPNDGEVPGRDDHYYNNITKDEYYEAKKLLQKKSYVGLYDPQLNENSPYSRDLAAFKKEMAI